MIALRAARYLGHSPAGGVMVLARSWLRIAIPVISARADDGDLRRRRTRDDDTGGDFWEAVHETLADLMLVPIVLHVAGVLLASVVHRENLTRSMCTGSKRAP